MKHFKYLLMLMAMLFAAVSFTACGDNDKEDEPVVPDVEVDPLVGTWRSQNTSATFILHFSADHTGYIQATVSTRASYTETQNFKWSKGVDSNGNTFVNILTTSGDELLEDGKYLYTVIDDDMDFGSMRFSRL